MVSRPSTSRCRRPPEHHRTPGSKDGTVPPAVTGALPGPPVIPVSPGSGVTRSQPAVFPHLRWIFPGCACRKVDRVFFLHVPTVSLAGQVQPDIRVKRVRVDWALLDASSLCLCVVDGQDRPALENLSARFPAIASFDCNRRHILAVDMVHPVDRDALVAQPNEEFLRDGPSLSCLLGPSPRKTRSDRGFRVRSEPGGA